MTTKPSLKITEIEDMLKPPINKQMTDWHCKFLEVVAINQYYAVLTSFT